MTENRKKRSHKREDPQCGSSLFRTFEKHIFDKKNILIKKFIFLVKKAKSLKDALKVFYSNIAQIFLIKFIYI